MTHGEPSPLAAAAGRPRRRGRLPMLLAALGVGGVALFLLLDWKELVARIHLRRLRTEPRYVLEIVERPEGTPDRLAIREWLEDYPGREAFFRVFLAEVHDRLPVASSASVGGTGLLGLNSADGLWFRCDDESSGLNLRLSPPQLRGSLSRLLALKQFLPLLAGETFRSEDRGAAPARGAVTFKVVSGSDARSRTGFCSPQGLPLESDEDYCLVVREAPAGEGRPAAGAAEAIQPPPRSASPR